MRKGVKTKQNKKEKANGRDNLGVIKIKLPSPDLKETKKWGQTTNRGVMWSRWTAQNNKETHARAIQNKTDLNEKK